MGAGLVHLPAKGFSAAYRRSESPADGVGEGAFGCFAGRLEYMKAPFLYLGARKGAFMYLVAGVTAIARDL